MMASQFSENGFFNVWNCRRFLFGMSYDESTVNVVFLLVTLNFELVSLDISSRHFLSDFSYSFDFHCLTNFKKGIDLLCKASLWCELLRNFQFTPRRVIYESHLWWEQFVHSFTSIQNSRSLSNTRTLNQSLVDTLKILTRNVHGNTDERKLFRLVLVDRAWNFPSSRK